MPQNMQRVSFGFEYRRVVPAKIRALIGKTAITKSLGRDYGEAKSQLAILEVETNAKFAAARAALANSQSLELYLSCPPADRLQVLYAASTPKLAEQISALWLSGLEVDLERRRAGELDDDEFNAISANVEEMLPCINKALATGNVQTFFPAIDSLLVCRGYRLSATPGEIQLLTHKVLEAMQVGYKVLAARQQGELREPETQPVPPLEAVWQPSQPKEKVKTKVPTLSDVTPIYAKHVSSINLKTASTNLSIWRRLVTFCKDKPLSQVQSNDIYRFLESCLTGDSSWSMSYANRAKHILREAFGLAQTHNLIEQNPVSMMSVAPRITRDEDLKRQRPRHPYTISQLNRIFESDWYAPDAKGWRGKMGQDLGARFWVPLICLYHGFRISEAIQLHPHDVSAGAVPLMTVQTEQEAGSRGPERTLKNASTHRTIPIHPQLLKLGFVAFVQSARDERPSWPLFPCALPDADAKNPVWGGAYEHAFLRHVKETLGFGAGYGNHSFRHTVEDQIRDVQIDDVWPAGLSQYYTGRRLSRDADKQLLRQQGSEINYGKGYTPERILPYVQKIQYSGLKLPLPFAEWLGDRKSVHASLLRTVKS